MILSVSPEAGGPGTLRMEFPNAKNNRSFLSHPSKP
jgi:hypothetical protein